MYKIDKKCIKSMYKNLRAGVGAYCCLLLLIGAYCCLLLLIAAYCCLFAAYWSLLVPSKDENRPP